MDPFALLAIVFVAGFAGGYTLRAQISHRRRRSYSRA